MKEIIKRDGRRTSFDPSKIMQAMEKAFKASDVEVDGLELFHLTRQIVEQLHGETCSVEEIQDLAERTLMQHGYYEVAKRYIIYREDRSKARDMRHRRYSTVAQIIKQTDRENANVGQGPSSKLLQLAEVIGREFMETNLTEPEVLAAMRENILYANDYSWGPIGTTTCCFIPLGKLLQEGFNTGHGFIRPPKRIKTASALSAIIIQANQNDQHGGQAYGWFDRDMAPYVEKEYAWQLRDLKSSVAALGLEEASLEALESHAWEKTRKETLQAMEALIHNLNTMHSRAGAQVPFCSINIGCDTSRGGRLISETLLLAYESGLGHHEQPIFPNIIWKMRSGVSVESQDPNYDLFRLALRVSATRLFPSYVNQDASFNRDFPEDVPTMGCRTRVSWDLHSPDFEQTCNGRGNISFNTINLVGLAIKASRTVYDEAIESSFQELKERYQLSSPNLPCRIFLVQLEEYLRIGTLQLMQRLEYQSGFLKKDFPFLMKGVWKRSEILREQEAVREVLKHGTLSLGFIGLAECLKVLIGKHHGESAEAQSFGIQIVSFMRRYLDDASQQYQYNFSLLATPAEGLTGKLAAKDRAIYGSIPQVTDKEWYTNSYHVPVEFSISILDKIAVEGPYHTFCNAGHISYIELDASPKDNLPALEKILVAMRQADMGYMSINYPVDRCRECQYQGFIENVCPVCGSKDIAHIRRITGYLAELDQFNAAKKAEERNRVRHGRV